MATVFGVEYELESLDERVDVQRHESVTNGIE
jgi:hypothetical protein